jgi:hypothetical protein
MLNKNENGALFAPVFFRVLDYQNQEVKQEKQEKGIHYPDDLGPAIYYSEDTAADLFVNFTLCTQVFSLFARLQNVLNARNPSASNTNRWLIIRNYYLQFIGSSPAITEQIYGNGKKVLEALVCLAESSKHSELCGNILETLANDQDLLVCIPGMIEKLQQTVLLLRAATNKEIGQILQTQKDLTLTHLAQDFLIKDFPDVPENISSEIKTYFPGNEVHCVLLLKSLVAECWGLEHGDDPQCPPTFKRHAETLKQAFTQFLATQDVELSILQALITNYLTKTEAVLNTEAFIQARQTLAEKLLNDEYDEKSYQALSEHWQELIESLKIVYPKSGDDTLSKFMDATIEYDKETLVFLMQTEVIQRLLLAGYINPNLDANALIALLLNHENNDVVINFVTNYLNHINIDVRPFFTAQENLSVTPFEVIIARELYPIATKLVALLSPAAIESIKNTLNAETLIKLIFHAEDAFSIIPFITTYLNHSNIDVRPFFTAQENLSVTPFEMVIDKGLYPIAIIIMQKCQNTELYNYLNVLKRVLKSTPPGAVELINPINQAVETLNKEVSDIQNEIRQLSDKFSFFGDIAHNMRDDKIFSIWNEILEDEKAEDHADPLFKNTKELVRRCYLQGNSWMRWRQHQVEVNAALNNAENTFDLIKKLSEISLDNRAGYLPRLIHFLIDELKIMLNGESAITASNHAERLGRLSPRAAASPAQR